MAGDIGMNVSARDLEQLSRRLKAQDGARVQRRYQRAIGATVPAIEADLQGAVRGVRVTSSRGGTANPDRGSRRRRSQGPLRARVAAAIGSRPTRKGARIYVDAERVDPQYGGSLPRYLDGELQQWRRWRHPVFGDKERWAQQTGSPWFFRTIRRHEGRVQQALERAMDDVANDIT